MTAPPAEEQLEDLSEQSAGAADAAESLGAEFDSALRAWTARASGGLSPLAYMTAAFDWTAHALAAPGQSLEIAKDLASASAEGWRTLTDAALQGAPDGGGRPHETAEAVLMALQQLHDANAGRLEKAVALVPGVSAGNVRKVQFALRQAAEALHPANFLATNPEVLRVTREERGANLARGWLNLIQDVAAPNAANGSGAHKVGETLATTPGRVVYRNELIELIQYEARTADAHREPILITPAWIMKYYILDLSRRNSLVAYLLDQGFTVFMISWRNPQADDRELTFDDYRRLGVLAALEAVEALEPGARVHAAGYCLGGTLLAVAAAGLGRDRRDVLASLTLIAAQTDFRDAGELALFIDEAQLAVLDSTMDVTGFLDGAQMAGAFSMLRSRELVWERLRRAYMLGQRPDLIDLMAWNADATRLPYRMHLEYLRRFYLNNDFAQGRLKVDGAAAAVSDIRAPMFVLGTTKDHVAPWRSVFKIHLFADVEVTFALTNGGHNAGVVSPPDHPRRRHQIHTKPDQDPYIDPDRWLELAERRDGSWWPSWAAWLAERSAGRRPAPVPRRAETASNRLPQDDPLPSAPGRYVFD